MSQSLRTPNGIAIRAVAAAALYASRRENQQTEDADGRAAPAPAKKIAVKPQKPAPKG